MKGCSSRGFIIWIIGKTRSAYINEAAFQIEGALRGADRAHRPRG